MQLIKPEHHSHQCCHDIGCALILFRNLVMQFSLGWVLKCTLQMSVINLDACLCSGTRLPGSESGPQCDKLEGNE